jgi:hypothetical protein
MSLIHASYSKAGNALSTLFLPGGHLKRALNNYNLLKNIDKLSESIQFQNFS